MYQYFIFGNIICVVIFNLEVVGCFRSAQFFNENSVNFCTTSVGQKYMLTCFKVFCRYKFVNVGNIKRVLGSTGDVLLIYVNVLPFVGFVTEQTNDRLVGLLARFGVAGKYFVTDFNVLNRFQTVGSCYKSAGNEAVTGTFGKVIANAPPGKQAIQAKRDLFQSHFAVFTVLAFRIFSWQNI